MRHYEIVLIIHPDQTEKISDIIQLYSKIINDNKGKIYRLEDWGRRQLAYSINKLHKAHYILMNVEIHPTFVITLESKFRFDDRIIRNLIILVKKSITTSSPIFKMINDNKDL